MVAQGVLDSNAKKNAFGGERKRKISLCFTSITGPETCAAIFEILPSQINMNRANRVCANVYTYSKPSSCLFSREKRQNWCYGGKVQIFLKI